MQDHKPRNTDHSPALGSAVPACAAARVGRPNEGGTWAGDAPPSNTASHNYNTGECLPLRWGVDSLYLSYQGDLFPDVVSRLDRLKKLAQSSLPAEQAQAQFPLGSHCFEVKDKGASRYPYILEDGHYRIQLSRPGKQVPMAYVKVSSGLLASVSPVEVEKRLYALLSQLGNLSSIAQVSRLDLFFDFASAESMEWSRECWVSRSGKVTAYTDAHNRFTGWTAGLGGDIAGRLYHKLYELQVSRKDYLLSLWMQVGWQPPTPVWRLEFEFKRPILVQFGLDGLASCLSHLGGLWSYATTEWLRLTLPNPDDQTRSRWPTHPLWEGLSSVDWGSTGGPLLRSYPEARLPGDDKLFSLGLAWIISYMAREGFDDLYEGQEAYVTALYSYHEDKASRMGLPFDDYIAEKLAIKRRAFNSLLNNPDEAEEAALDEQQRNAKLYRREADGG